MATKKATTKTATKKTTAKTAAKKPTAKKAPAKTVSKKPAAASTAKKAVANKSTTAVQKPVAKKKSMADIYNTNVSILLAMAIEAMILLLGYLIIMSAA